MADKILSPAECRKEFLRLFKELCHSRTSWQVWADLISVFAISIANSVEYDTVRREDREKEFTRAVKALGGIDIPAQMLCCMVNALERKPDQDFLGEIFMELNLGNHWKGQFFTPFSICRCMAEMTCGNVVQAVKDKGWASVCDPACGAGATLIGMLNALTLRDVNYQTDVMFVCQDIDRIAGLMCFTQLSLLGCPGYVVIADSLTNPIVGDSIFPVEQPGQEFWYTPMYYRDCWTLRRTADAMKQLLAG